MRENVATSSWLIDASLSPRSRPRNRVPQNSGVIESHDSEKAKPQASVAKIRHQPVIKCMALPMFATLLVTLFVGLLSAILFLAVQLMRK